VLPDGSGDINDWVDDSVVEPIIGQSILSGVPVRLEPLSATIRA
jgi:hypothetical protein